LSQSVDARFAKKIAQAALQIAVTPQHCAEDKQGIEENFGHGDEKFLPDGEVRQWQG
jgi:hypothetical protein